MKSNYNNYFKDHYQSTFDEKWIMEYKDWFYSQYNFIESKIKFIGKILEIGSGLGRFYNLLPEEQKKNYIGLELDEDAASFANSYFKTNIFLNESLEEFKSTQLFDRIYAFEVLEHLDNPLLGIEKIYTLLNDYGVFVGTSPYPYIKSLQDSTHMFVLHPENWKKLFLKSGFKRVEIIPMSFIPFLWRINKNLNIRLPFYIPFKNVVSTCLIVAKK